MTVFIAWFLWNDSGKFRIRMIKKHVKIWRIEQKVNTRTIRRLSANCEEKEKKCVFSPDILARDQPIEVPLDLLYDAILTVVDTVLLFQLRRFFLFKAYFDNFFKDSESGIESDGQGHSMSDLGAYWSHWREILS